jgi:predicted phage-related endonuclease
MEWTSTTTSTNTIKQKHIDIQSPDDSITRSVMIDLKERADRGLKKYNTTLGENNHQNMLQHAYEEALDLAQYLKKEISTLNTIQDLVKQVPNDIELGKAIRAKYGQK